MSSSLSNANSAFGLILGFFSYHGWNIYLLPAGGFSKLLFAGLSREHGRNRPGKSCSSTLFFLYSENAAVHSVHVHTFSALLSLLTQWLKRKFRCFAVETEIEMQV